MNGGAYMEQFDYSAALITVTETETAAIKQLYNWQPLNIECDEQAYYCAGFERDNKHYRVVYARQNEMGMTAGAVLSMKLIQHFRPRYLIMVGIAAGVARADIEDQIYGDVIAADVIWNYSAGKFVSPDDARIKFGEVGFIPRPTVIEMQPELRGYIELAAASDENQCHVYIGPMACGSSVVANNEILDKQIRSQNESTAGLDMESYAVAYAARNATQPKPASLIIKRVCDYADSAKSDQYQKFAAYTSCEFAKLLYEKFLPLD